MSQQSISLLALAVVATAALTSRRFVTGGGAVATAAGNALGVARSDGAIGDRVPVDVIGTAVVEASAAIAANAAIEVAADGKAVTATTGEVVARAAPGATAAAAGDFLEVILITN